jgi:hypothetical protein
LLGGAAAIWVIGLVVGTVMLVITGPCAILWALIVDRLLDRGFGVAA